MTYRGLVDDVAYALDQLKVTRKITLGFAMWITYFAFSESVRFAYSSELDGLATGAVIGALTTPVSGFVGFVAKFYYDGHKSNVGGG